MPLQTFVDKVGPVVSAAWLNAVDLLKFTIFNDSTTKAQARTALTEDAPLEVANGGTGQRTLSGLSGDLLPYLYPASDAETNAGVTPTDYSYPPGDVRRYGAVGDGTTDDTTALQAWISVGGHLVVPQELTCILADGLLVNSNTVIDGGGTLKMKAASVLAVGIMLQLDTKQDVVIRDITLDGNKASNDINDNYGDGIRTYASQRIRIENCRILNMPRDGISIAKHPTSGSNYDIQILNNFIDGCGATSQTTGGEGILAVEGARIVIQGNICTNNKYRGIELETLTTTLHNLTVTGNICNTNAVGIGINGSNDMAITGNNCEANTDKALSIETSVPATAGFIAVSGNKFSDSPTAVNVQNYTQINVTGNIIHDCTTGVKFQDCSQCVVGSNSFSNTTTEVDLTLGTNSGIFVRNNSGFITEAAGTATILSGATTVTVTHGLAYTPSAPEISILPLEQGTIDYGRFWVDTITSTQFRVNVSLDPGASNLDIGWAVRRV